MRLLGRIEMLDGVAEHRAGHLASVFVEEADQQRAVDPLADFAQHPADSLLDEVVFFAQQFLCDLECRRRVAALDEAERADDRDSAFPELVALGEGKEDIARVVEVVLADEELGRRVDEIPVVDATRPGSGEVVVDKLLTGAGAILRHHDEESDHPMFVDVAPQQLIEIALRQLGEPLRGAASSEALARARMTSDAVGTLGFYERADLELALQKLDGAVHGFVEVS